MGTAKIIDGKACAAAVKTRIQAEAAQIKADHGKTIGLAVIIVGGNPASRIYVNNKRKDCEEVGFESFEYALPEETTQDALLSFIDMLNDNEAVDGILVQLPLPKHLDEKSVLDRISPDKDVDAFHPVNVGRIMIGDYRFLPCTPAGVMEMLKSENISISGKECVVVGRSNIVGKPMAMLLLHESGTVTICHSRTKDLAEVCRRADILVAAVGVANLITGDMVKEGAVVIDVGMNRLESGKLCGDVDYASVAQKASYITPVPGGVGPMTRAMLMQNTLTAVKTKLKL
ncbi:MAG: bifunctional methylenetetrahydrofolate dehydrogenase/methenyltetrahydrofolate cyclohydrolase FolD [Oscillospiraceae bacterium]